MSHIDSQGKSEEGRQKWLRIQWCGTYYFKVVVTSCSERHENVSEYMSHTVKDGEQRLVAQRRDL